MSMVPTISTPLSRLIAVQTVRNTVDVVLYLFLFLSLLSRAVSARERTLPLLKRLAVVKCTCSSLVLVCDET